ncbi:hypothetical protein AKJ09_01718 [Labilithrix luteola]|uniref:Uncharacterized protein n=1 Tax=Labilithrix luteola TaxID=1391654 RepID=A0A0K1PPK5_9BACT|nr:hypothetical protein AKJ09_01718 [Labilithrix luteola]
MPHGLTVTPANAAACPIVSQSLINSLKPPGHEALPSHV